MKDSILLIFFTLLILIIAFISLFVLRALVFLVINYHAVEGIRFSLLSTHGLSIVKEILPFAVICTIITLFVRMYKKPGILWLSYIFIFIISSVVWFSGYHFLHDRNTAKMENNSVPLLFTENIHDTEDFRIYVAEKKGDTAYSGVSLRLGFESDIADLRYISEVNPGAMSPINPTFSPIIKVSAMFDTIIQEISVFDSELRRLIREDQTLFILLSIEILAFFIFSGTLIRLSKFPLFLVVVMIITLRFFFFIFAGFVDGRPALLLDILLPWDIYKPLIGIGYFSLILFFISIRYSLVHPRNRRELPT